MIRCYNADRTRSACKVFREEIPNFSKIIYFFLGKINKKQILENSKMKTRKDVMEKQKRIIEEMRKNPQITYWDLQLILKISEKAVYKNIKKLKDAGIVRRLGPRYKSVDRRWEVLE